MLFNVTVSADADAERGCGARTGHGIDRTLQYSVALPGSMRACVIDVDSGLLLVRRLGEGSGRTA